MFLTITVCSFTWCCMWTCCIFDFSWCAGAWGRDSRLWLSNISFPLPPRPAKLLCPPLLQEEIHIGHSLWAVQIALWVSKWQVQQCPTALCEPRSLTLVLVLSGPRFAWTLVLSCSCSGNNQAFMRDWGNWISPEATELGKKFGFVTALKLADGHRGCLNEQKWDEVLSPGWNRNQSTLS